MAHKVLLTYFKPGGKYYSDGEMTAPIGTPLYEIFQEVGHMKAAGQLPGINGKDWHVLIRVPDHPHDHPHLLPA